MRISYICIVLCFYFSVVFTSELQTDSISIGFCDNNNKTIHTLQIKQKDILKSGTLKDLMDSTQNFMSSTSKDLTIPIKDVPYSNLKMIQEFFNIFLDEADTLETALRRKSDENLIMIGTIADYFNTPIIYNNFLKIMIKRILADKEKYKDIDQDDSFGINQNYNIKNSIKKELIKNIRYSPVKNFTLKGHTYVVCSVVWSKDDRLIASGSADNTIKIWDVVNQQCVNTLYGHTDYVNSATFSKDSRFIASGSHDGTIRIWDVASQQCIGILYGHMGCVCSVVWSNDDCFLVSGSWGGVKIWDMASQQCISTLKKGDTDYVRSVALSNDDRFIVSSYYIDGTIRIWDVASQQCVGILKGHEDYVNSVACSKNGRLIISGSHDGTIKIWDVASQQCISTLTEHKKKGHIVSSVALSHDDRFIVSGSYDDTIKIWDNIAYLDINNTIAEILYSGMQQKICYKQLISMFSGIGAGMGLSYLVYKYMQK